MNNEEFGRIAILLCRTDEVDYQTAGCILWHIYEDFKDKKSGDWK